MVELERLQKHPMNPINQFRPTARTGSLGKPVGRRASLWGQDVTQSPALIAGLSDQDLARWLGEQISTLATQECDRGVSG